MIFISGSTSGIGFGIAEKLISLGSKVAITGTSQSKIDKIFKKKNKQLKNILIIKCDLTNRDECQNAIYETIKKFKKIDSLILNLGSGRNTGKSESLSYSIEKMFKINFWPSVFLIEKSLEYLIKSKGNVISISSICAINNIIEAPIGYSVSKNSLQKLMRLFSKKYSKYGIRFNSVVPGNINFSGSTWDLKLKKEKLKTLNYIKKNVPLNKLGNINNVIEAVCFLLQNDNFMTGSEIIVDGGQTL